MRSPLKARPLRNAGESVHSELEDLLFGDVMVFVIVALFLILLAGLEWWRWHSQTPPSPITWSAVALCGVGIATFKVIQGLRRAKQLKLGRDGEKAVGQHLERLRAVGAHVLHDFPGDCFNVDHIVIHQSGVYAVETRLFRSQRRAMLD